jgi:predicted secreted hydrolase
VKARSLLFGVFVALCANAAPDYPTVVPGRVISFPQDEGAHPDYRTEWWYVTGWLEQDDGASLGFQITFFRARPGIDEDNPSRFAARQLLFAHVAVSDPRRGRLIRDERSAREGFGLAQAEAGSLDVRIDDWVLEQEGGEYRASIRSKTLNLELRFAPSQPPLLQGEGGYSRKGPDPASASYYYSLPQLRTSGRARIEGEERSVRGVAWFDHEWSTALMDEQAHGWDWIGVNLDDGGALMAWRMRDASGGVHWAAGMVREGSPPYRTTSYAPEQVEWTPLRHWRSPHSGVTYPVQWKVRLGGRTIRLEPLMDDQENDARGSTGTLYWEGAVRVLDDEGGSIGRGYLELTGYARRVKF